MQTDSRSPMTNKRHSSSPVQAIQNGEGVAMYDSVAVLKAYGEPTYDGYGNEFLQEITTTVFVQPRGVYNAEFYNAAQAGLHPSITFELTNREDYSGQSVVNWEGEDYNIIRTDWDAQRDNIRLICEKRVHNG